MWRGREVHSTRCFCSSRRSSHLGGRRDAEVGVVDPSAGVRSALPTLHGYRQYMLALLVVEDFHKRSAETSPHLGRRSTEVNEPIAAVVEHRHRAPPLGLRFGLIKHCRTLLGHKMGYGKVIEMVNEVKRMLNFSWPERATHRESSTAGARQAPRERSTCA